MNLDHASQPPEAAQILAENRGKKVLFAVDFDGTLTSVVSNPDDVIFSDNSKKMVTRIAEKFGLVICTGRAMKDLVHYIPEASGLDLIANHGMEWRICDRTRTGSFVVREFVPNSWWQWRQKQYDLLLQEVKKHGGEIEDKRLSVTIHYRTSGEDWWTSEQGVSVLRLLASNQIGLLPGKCAWNLVPLGVSKGEALIQYAREFIYDLIVYLGDEPTDETVFERKELPMIGIKVGNGPTGAQFRLKDVPAVIAWLNQLSIFDSGFM